MSKPAPELPVFASDQQQQRPHGQQQQPAYSQPYQQQSEGAPPPYTAQPFQGQAHTTSGQTVYTNPPPQQQVQYSSSAVPSAYSQPVVASQPQVIYYANAPAPQAYRGPVMVQGGAACGKCGTVYPIPRGSYSWRCKACGEFNNLQGDQCVIL